MNIGSRIKQMRIAKGLSQEQLAEVMQVSRQAISKWECNDAVPDLENIIVLSDFFKVTIDEIVKGDSSKEKNGFAFQNDRIYMDDVLWEKIKLAVKELENASNVSYLAWIAQLQYRMSGEKMIISCKGEMEAQYISEKYLPTFIDILVGLGIEEVRLEVSKYSEVQKKSNLVEQSGGEYSEAAAAQDFSKYQESETNLHKQIEKLQKYIDDHKQLKND